MYYNVHLLLYPILNVETFQNDIMHHEPFSTCRYPGPRDRVEPGSDAALMMNVYQPRSKTAAGTRNNNAYRQCINKHFGII